MGKFRIDQQERSDLSESFTTTILGKSLENQLNLEPSLK